MQRMVCRRFSILKKVCLFFKTNFSCLLYCSYRRVPNITNITKYKSNQIQLNLNFCYSALVSSSTIKRTGVTSSGGACILLSVDHLTIVNSNKLHLGTTLVLQVRRSSFWQGIQMMRCHMMQHSPDTWHKCLKSFQGITTNNDTQLHKQWRVMSKTGSGWQPSLQ